MLRREFLQSIACAALQSVRPATRLTFLVILSDAQGIGDVGCFGAADVEAPNLDRLAAAGVLFTKWQTNSHACSPSRASVMTGK